MLEDLTVLAGRIAMLRKMGQCAGGPRIEDAEILVVDFYAATDLAF